MSHLQQLKIDVAFLQETHLCNASVASLKRNWVGQVYHSKFNVKARGTAILINKDISFQSKKIIVTLMGDMLLLLDNSANPVILVNFLRP